MDGVSRSAFTNHSFAMKGMPTPRPNQTLLQSKFVFCTRNSLRGKQFLFNYPHSGALARGSRSKAEEITATGHVEVNHFGTRQKRRGKKGKRERKKIIFLFIKIR